MSDQIHIHAGARIRYRFEGSGPAVLLLHGFTEHLGIWDDFTRVLMAEYTVIRIDLPGHGESECIGETHSMEGMAILIKEVMRVAGIAQCTLVGHSMGGYVCLAFAELFPESVSGLCLFHSSALPDSAEAKQRRDKIISLVQRDHFSFLSTFIPDLFAPANRARFAKEIEGLIASANKMGKVSIIASLAGMRDRPDRTAVLAAATYPVLFMIGKLDSRVDHRQVMEQALLPDDSVVLLMGHAGHMGYLEEREKTLYALQVFLQGISFNA